MGRDETVVGAARVSYDKGMALDEVERNKKLINFLMQHGHTSPFEQCVLTFECKMPIFVAREWVRHRTARLNEVSGRYTQLESEVYTPERSRIKGQDTVNKQGSAGDLSDNVKSWFLADHASVTEDVFRVYNDSIQSGIAKELARIDLPLSTYTRWVWQCDLHNLLHFLKLRMAAGAQWEIRQYANTMAEMVKLAYPMVWAAFEEHSLNSVKLSGTESIEVSKYLHRFLSEAQAVGLDNTEEYERANKLWLKLTA